MYIVTSYTVTVVMTGYSIYSQPYVNVWLCSIRVRSWDEEDDHYRVIIHCVYAFICSYIAGILG